MVCLSSDQLILKEPVFRPRQAEILPQRPPLILVPENPALLQFRHHLVDEVVETCGQEREHDVEPVAAEARQPFLHLIGNQRGRADKRQPAIAADALCESSHFPVVVF